MGLAALKQDYLFVLPLMQARLADQVPDIPVDIVETVEDVLAADHRANVLMVMYAGELVTANAARVSTALTHRYLVLVALSNVAKGTNSRNRKAGPLMSATNQALVGWTPEGAATPMRRASTPTRPDFTKTKALYPMAFEIDLNL
jgi:hypothetical protein